jgi:hypothetical protein
MRRTLHIFALAALATVLTPVMTAAQQPPNTKPKVAPKIERRDDPKACAHARATVGSDGGLAVPKKQDQSLSEQLAESNGVICPPHVDPEMRKPAPKTGTMPVIPPPSSTNPHIQPK